MTTPEEIPEKYKHWTQWIQAWEGKRKEKKKTAPPLFVMRVITLHKYEI